MPKRTGQRELETVAGSEGELEELAQLLAEHLEDTVATRFHPAGTWPGLGDQALVCAFRENDASRLVLSGLLILGGAVTAESLRAVPISKLEEQANQARATAAKLPGSHEAGPGHYVISPDFRFPDLPKLDVADLRRTPDLTPDEFSQRVATEYKLWAMRVPNPAKAMADAHGVKLPTMHSWVREARLRGYLPPGRRGKT